MDIQHDKAEPVRVAIVAEALGPDTELTPVKRTIAHETGRTDIEYALILSSDQYQKLT